MKIISGEISGGVTAPKGFLASGIHCGLKKSLNKKDLACIYSEKICTTAAVYTKNVVKGEPLLVTIDRLSDSLSQAIIINSGNANTCTGKAGYDNAVLMTEITAQNLKIDPKNVLVASTGVIGVQLNMDFIKEGIPKVCSNPTKEGHIDAREAIMTTDTIKKDIAVEINIKGKKVRIGAMAKGSGMIHPNMATMLSFITTDINIEADLLKEALTQSVNQTYNMISVDGDTSTNDMVVVMANGMAENEKLAEKDEDFDTFAEALNFINTELAKKIAKDGEGATKLVECRVFAAKTDEDAKKIAISIIRSNLVKTAMFGSDANWGRILCAVGYSEGDFDKDKVNVSFESNKGYINVCDNGTEISFDEEKAKVILSEEEVIINVNLKCGDCSAVAWGCDLSYEYVRINGDYRS